MSIVVNLIHQTVNKLSWVIFLFCISTHISVADFIAIPESKGTISDDGRWLLRVDFKKSIGASNLSVFKFDSEVQGYDRVSEFKINWFCLHAFISSNGKYIVTVDDRFSIGRGPNVIVVFNSNGKRLKSWALKDFYDPSRIKKLTQTVSITKWHSKVEWAGTGQTLLFHPPKNDDQGIGNVYSLSLASLSISLHNNATKVPGNQ